MLKRDIKRLQYIVIITLVVMGPGLLMVNIALGSDLAEHAQNNIDHKRPQAINIINLPKHKDTTEFDVRSITQGLLKIRDNHTNLVPSHIGHPGYEDLCFLYDISVTALVLYAAGYQSDAEAILDYFAQRLSIPMQNVIDSMDTNGIFGIIKIIEVPDGSGTKKLKSLVNAIDITATSSQGRGLLEFYTTPGPLSFMVFAMLQVNTDKYKDTAVEIGESILSMQEADGGVRDGDRAVDRVHTEPNMDAYAAFLMLHQATGDDKWLKAANKAYEWFSNNVYEKKDAIIYQGMWQDHPSEIFATDAYSWTMAGPAGDKLTPQELTRLTDTMLINSITKVTVDLPDNSRRTVILADFSNALDARVVNARKGLHPMGTVEWTGGVILALQKNAVRLWQADYKDKAKEYKALAQALLKQTSNCYYRVGEDDVMISFYATAQGLEIAPFGAIQNKSASGWLTTFYYVKNDEGKTILEGGASIGSWPLLPYLGVNPFVLHDTYKETYDLIPMKSSDYNKAVYLLEEIAEKRTYTEEVPTTAPDKRVQIVEPRMFNKNVWKAMVDGYKAKKNGSDAIMKKNFKEAISWAKKVIQNPVWIELAKSDNRMKDREIGGIIYYPWGTAYPNNEHPLHFAIQRYPLLNEVGTSAWALASAYCELGDYKKAKRWIGKVIDDFPLHQIAAVDDNQPDLIIGYWSALVSWEDKTLSSFGDTEIYRLYKEVLSEKGLSSARPTTIVIPTQDLEAPRSDMSPTPRQIKQK